MKNKARQITTLIIRSVLPLFLGLAALVLVIAWLSGMFMEKIPPGQGEKAVRHFEGGPTDEIHEVVKNYEDEALGTLKASSRTVISAKVLATIEEVAVSAGDVVVTGDLLVRLSSDEFTARLNQAKQSLVASQAVRKQAELAFERNEKLRRNAPNVVTDEQLQRVDAQLQTARADELRAEQAVTEAEVRLSYTTIVAPKKGKIVDRLAEPGDNARPGEPLLVLYDATSLRLEAPVVEKLAVGLRRGQKLLVRIDALDREEFGTVDEIVPQAESLSRSFLVKVSLPPTEDLFEGMFGRLVIPAGSRKHLCLPTSAVQTIGQLEFVDVVRITDDGEVLERRLVKTGRLGMEGRVEVLSGVSAHERVVLHEHLTNKQGLDSMDESLDPRGEERLE